MNLNVVKSLLYICIVLFQPIMENVTPIAGENTRPKEKRNAARETLYRVTMQNQLRSVSIADQKANIIVGINTILISIIIAILGMEMDTDRIFFVTKPSLQIPLTIMLVGSFVSGMLALFVVRPVSKPWKKGSQSRLFFRDFENISLDEFKSDIREILLSGETIYDCLSTDMYLYGQAVHRKYRILRIAYFVFLAGMTLTVVSFFVLRMFI